LQVKEQVVQRIVEAVVEVRRGCPSTAQQQEQSVWKQHTLWFWLQVVAEATTPTQTQMHTAWMLSSLLLGPCLGTAQWVVLRPTEAQEAVLVATVEMALTALFIKIHGVALLEEADSRAVHQRSPRVE